MYRSSTHLAVRQAIDLTALGETPRFMDNHMQSLLHRLSPSWLEYVDPQRKPRDSASFAEWGLIGVFFILTLGIMPAIFISAASTRKKRVKRFLRMGTPGVAEITGMESERGEFDTRVFSVSYQFEANGAMHRDCDTVLPAATYKWQPGDRIQILYMPEFDYESIIISGR